MIPASLRHRIGSPDYYLSRHIDHIHRHGGHPPPPPYYLESGIRYAERFRSTVSRRLSAAGKRWVAAVMVELQEALEDLRDDDPAAFGRLECCPADFDRQVFRTHSAAYLRCGYTALPMTDMARVVRAIDRRTLLHPRTLREVLIVARALPPIH